MARDEAYRIAERKIEKARIAGVKELDLSIEYGEKNPKLTELPESLGQLKRLQSLNLNGNQLTALPESLGRLTQLQSLNLASNQLTALPESLGKLTQLQSLNLTDNQLTALPDSLDKLTELKELDISGTQLKTLPESISQLTRLESLYLSSSQLTALPKSLCQLKQLRSLSLSDNQLTALPECLFQLKHLLSLNLSGNQLTVLVEPLGQLTQLRELDLSGNRLEALPESLGKLTQLRELDLSGNPLKELPKSVGQLTQLESLDVCGTKMSALPEWLCQLTQLQSLGLGYFNNQASPISQLPSAIGEINTLWVINAIGCQLVDLPTSLGNSDTLTTINLENNPLNPELAAAYKEGLDSLKRYLRAKAGAQVVLNEAKLILIGEGEVGKSALLGALRGDEWVEKRDSTHGIEIKPVKVTNPTGTTEITLNGWDFGGQRVYRPTHQLFFSAPAVYLVAWKPREGPQQGFVKEWIKLVKHREPEAKILVVATHGGPGTRQPDIDRQELWDLFGKETVVDFFHVQSRPPKLNKKTGKRTGTGVGIKELRETIARVAASLPEVGRTVPKHWQEAREKLRRCKEAYLPLERVFAICKEHKIEEDDARLLLRICRRVGDLIHYEHDPLLKDIVVLKPDWLATAMSFVLDDEETRQVGHGLVSSEKLSQLWHNEKKPKENRYAAKLHPVFLRLMERFDLSYRVAETGKSDGDCTSLIAQLVPDVRPDPVPSWAATATAGDEEQVQICRIVDTTNNQSANAEGLFYQLIVRLHKYSLGRADYSKSSHWQRGLVLEDDTGARAFLEHVGNDVRITVRSPYPERFLAALTYEVKWLVEDFWKGMRCEVTVPCLTNLPNAERCKGLFEVGKLLENKKRGRPEQPCQICNEWQSIEALLHNAPAARPNPMVELLTNFTQMMRMLEGVRQQLGTQQAQIIGRFDNLDATSKELVSKVEAAYSGLMHTLLDEAKEGPRLFSFEPVEPGFLDRPKWMSAKFKLTLWCEHSRRPLWHYSNGTQAGVYTIDLPRDWLVKAAPFLKIVSSTLGLVLPVVAATAKVALPEADYKGIEAQLALGKATAESLLKGGGQVGEWLSKDDDLDLAPGSEIRAHGGTLRQLHAWLKEKDPTFGGLVRVQNKRQEFLWVHPQFEKEY